jgi:membrane peptidoglycan carboxypeptidase
VLRRRRRIAVSTAVIVGLLLLLVAAGYVYLLMLPGVGDAERRVQRILREHGGAPVAVPPPAKLAAATVSVEDENFYAGAFVDVVKGAGRAALASLQTSEDPGGSTIAQQLAKRLYPHGGGVAGTLEEIGLGVKLSLHYSHAQVLAMYLNSIYYGNGYWGAVAAAHGYFGTPVRELTWGEAAMLAGLPQAPTAYDPVHHLAPARERQQHVLEQLVVNGYLSAAAAEGAFAEPLPLRSGTATSRGSADPARAASSERPDATNIAATKPSLKSAGEP